MNRILQGSLLGGFILLISQSALAADDLATLKKRYPQHNLRLTIDGVGWATKTPNVSVGYRNGANYYGLMYQQNSFDESSEKYTRKMVGLDLKRYFQNKPWVTRMTLHYVNLAIKNSFDSISEHAVQLEPQIGARYFIAPRFWIEAFVGAKLLVVGSVEVYKDKNKTKRKVINPSGLNPLQAVVRLEVSYEFGLGK